jgi:glutamate racemase
MIGIFDSGIGGLTVVRALRKRLPDAHILYVGDVARMPYGNKSEATVTEYARQITQYLVRRGAKIVVIACNTASAVAADALREEFSVPILDVITPAVRSAASGGARGAAAVLGTRATISTGVYQDSLRALPAGKLARAKQSRDRRAALSADRDDGKIYALACPLFVPIVEEGLVGTKEGLSIVERTLRPLLGKKISSVILGCTHYPLLRKEISRVFPDAELIDSSAVAEDVAELAALDPTILGGRGPKLEIAVTDRTEHFERFAGRIIGKGAKLKKLGLEELMR